MPKGRPKKSQSPTKAKTPITKIKTTIVNALVRSEKQEQEKLQKLVNATPQKGQMVCSMFNAKNLKSSPQKSARENPETASINSQSEEKVKMIFERQQQRDLKKAGVDSSKLEGTILMGYISLNEKFTLQGQNQNLFPLIQYATYYFLRLSLLKDKVIESAKKKWKKEEASISYVKDILEIKYDTKTVIAGTLYKEMQKKPCILKHLDGVLGSRKPRNYCSESDLIILEDSSGRIRVKPCDNFMPGYVITGSIVALKGEADINGIFHIDDYCFANYYQSPKMSIPKQIKLNKPKRELLDPDLLLSDRKFIIFISGFEIGIDQDSLSLEIFSKMIRCESGSVDEQKLMSQVQRVIICGNSLVPPEGVENVQKGSYGCASLNQNCYTKINDYLDQLEITLNKLSTFIDVDLMPGEFDISTAVMPQQPLNRALFPNLLKCEKINFVTNPHQFNINGIRFLGTSGQNIKDIRMFAESWKDPIEIMEHTLKLRHLCPTSPDTLRSYSFTETDPFVIQDAPHVYFCGNQPIYGEKWVTFDEDDDIEENQKSKIISVPSFRIQRKFILLDLETLDCYDYQIDCSSLIQIQKQEKRQMTAGQITQLPPQQPNLLEFSQGNESDGQIEFDEDGGSQD